MKANKITVGFSQINGTGRGHYQYVRGTVDVNLLDEKANFSFTNADRNDDNKEPVIKIKFPDGEVWEGTLIQLNRKLIYNEQ